MNSDAQRTADWSAARRILCVRLDNLGDVLMTTPAIRALRDAAPDRHITLWASSSGTQAAARVPEVDEVITYDAPWVKHSTTSTADDDLRMAQRLADGRFDAAVIFTVYSQNPMPAATVCRLAGIPLRIAHCRENPYAMLTDWVPETEPQNGTRHEVQRQLDLVARTGARTESRRLSFAVTEADRAGMHACLKRQGVDITRPWMVVHAGATAASRRYPAERFAAVARGLVRKLDCQIVFSGTHDERMLVELLRRAGGAKTFALAGELSLGEFGALIDEAAVLVSNNSGPVHIAAARGTPVVDLYALTNPQHTPWMVPNRVLFHDVACKYCYKSVCPQGHNDCLRRVSPEEVVAAAAALWEERGMPRRPGKPARDNIISLPGAAAVIPITQIPLPGRTAAETLPVAPPGDLTAPSETAGV